jgi:hypothetical protein
MLITFLPFTALALLSAVVANPINGQDAKDVVDFHAFPEFAGLGSLEDLVEEGASSSDADVDVDADADADVDGEGIEARAANQCTLGKLKKILFDYSESDPIVPPRWAGTVVPNTNTTNSPQKASPNSKPPATPNRPAASTGPRTNAL